MHTVVNVIRYDLYGNDKDIMFPFLKTGLPLSGNSFLLFLIEASGEAIGKNLAGSKRCKSFYAWPNI